MGRKSERKVFEKTGHPRDLTWIIVGAHGGRGRIPGTIEELAFPAVVLRGRLRAESGGRGTPVCGVAILLVAATTPRVCLAPCR
jgi:hypothetical protein